MLPRLGRPRELLALGLGILGTLRRQGTAGLRHYLAAGRAPATFGDDYRRWIARYDTLDEADRLAIRRRIEALGRRPLISVLLPVHDPPPPLLGRAIDSVRRQLYPHWELCVADDASRDPGVRRVLEDRAATDPRIRVVYRPRRGHISEATNSALELAGGEFVALLDHDDELAETALYQVAAELERHPDADFLYSDHDKIDRHGRRSRPYFKPDWDPDLIRGQNFAAHLAVLRASRVRELGGLRPGLEGSQDHDLILRMTEATPEARIRHLPFVLYHWRSIPSSVASSPRAKPYAAAAARRAVREHLERTGGHGAEVAPAALAQFVRVVHPLPEPAPRITLLWVARGHRAPPPEALRELLRATAYRPLEVIAPAPPAGSEPLPREIDGVKVAVRMWREGASRSAAINEAAAGAAGDLLALVDARLVPESAAWLGELARHALRPEIGAVGAKLLGPGGRVVEAGLLLHPAAVAVPACAGLGREAPGYHGRACLAGSVSAVSSRCLVLRRPLFTELGGLDDETAPDRFAGVDLCLRLRERGYRVVWSPEAMLRLAGGGDGDGPRAEEIARLRSRWGERLSRDPCYSPNLSLEPGLDFRLAFPPAVRRTFGRS